MPTKNVQQKTNRTIIVATRFTEDEMELLHKAAFNKRVRPSTLLRNLFLNQLKDQKDSEASINNCK